ncbi:MAG TPA: response regulator [Vicinamibacterales bacterium]|nr:response regulator [Vicinamibacterales bacterium]
MATILIVDDIAANREVLRTLLSYQHHRLLEAADGREGLALARSEHPDLVITDVLMPIMDGYELVRQLRLHSDTSGIPVVFYTAHYGEREARALALSSGVMHVLTKPVDPEDVLRVVSSVLSGHVTSGERTQSDPLSTEFDQEHLRLLTNKLSQTDENLRSTNARLRALINISLELASERNPGRLLHNVCLAARDLFGASYVTLGILDRKDRTVKHFVASGVKAGTWIQVGDTISGILATIVAERRTIRGENLDGDPDRLELPTGHPEVRAFLVAPVASPVHVYGWICLVGNEGRAFSDDDEDLVVALSGLVGRIYENGHLYTAAQKEADRAQRYLETADVILLALDIEGRVTLINRKGCELLGCTELELLGRDWIETCLPARSRQALRESFHNVLSGELGIVEHPVLTRYGEERLIEWRNQVLRDETGCVIGTLSSGTDVTAHNEAVEALRVSEERTRFALRNAGVGIWDMDYTTGVLRWSETIEAHYGLEPGTFGGTFDAFVERIHPDDRAAVLATVEQAVKAGSDFSLQNRSIWPDGTVRWLSGIGRILLAEDGKPVRAVGISLDVTDRHSLEEQYHQAQKMEAVGRLAGGVAHDFNNLLTAILGYCELLLDAAEPGDPRRADISEIQKAGLRAAGLTRQLLAFSRKQIINPILLDLNVIVADMRGMLERLIGEDVTVVLRTQSELAPVKADRGQIEQIVMNLAVNARDAMPRGGTLTIESANVELDEEYAKTHLSVKPGSYVMLAVSDTGTGMTPEVQARLFEPFFTTKDVGKGTGLGLATVHGIVARSGGNIDVFSEVERGSSFKVYFPRADATEAIPEAPPISPQLNKATQTVLVVEDEPGLRELAKRLLERQGYTVFVAANADEASRFFDETSAIDVLLTDVVMPGASGPELTQALIGRKPGLHVIYMSGYTEDAIVHHGILAPGIAFLQKPFTSETLGRKIQQILKI